MLPTVQRILFVDDEIHATDAIVVLLSSEGFTVDCVQSGHEALACAQTHTYAAVVLDLHLPDVLGLTVLNTWRREGRRIPVIAITGWYLGDAHEDAAASLGAACFRRKPLDASELATALRDAIRACQRDPAWRGSGVAASNAGTVLDPTREAGARGAHSAALEDRVRGLHDLILTGDGQAIDELAACVLPFAKSRLRRRRIYSGAADWVEDAVHDAFIDYWRAPGRYDPSRGLLSSYLLLAAHRNLLDRIQRERRLAAKHVLLARDSCIAEEASFGGADVMTHISRLTWDFTKPEVLILELLFDRERRTDVYADVLGIAHLPPSIKRAEVKRAKDRVRQRLRRRILLERSNC